MRMLERVIAVERDKMTLLTMCIFESLPAILARWESPGATDTSAPDLISDSHPFYRCFFQCLISVVAGFRRLKGALSQNPSDCNNNDRDRRAFLW